MDNHCLAGEGQQPFIGRKVVRAEAAVVVRIGRAQRVAFARGPSRMGHCRYKKQRSGGQWDRANEWDCCRFHHKSRCSFRLSANEFAFVPPQPAWQPQRSQCLRSGRRPVCESVLLANGTSRTEAKGMRTFRLQMRRIDCTDMDKGTSGWSGGGLGRGCMEWPQRGLQTHPGRNLGRAEGGRQSLPGRDLLCSERSLSALFAPEDGPAHAHGWCGRRSQAEDPRAPLLFLVVSAPTQTDESTFEVKPGEREA